MTMAKIGKRFPWKTALLGFLVVILLVVLIGVLLPDVGAWLIGGALAIGAFLLYGAIACFTNLFFWAGFGLMGIVFFVYFYRKNYAKKRVLIPTTTGSVLPAVDRLATPLFDENTKVESA